MSPPENDDDVYEQPLFPSSSAVLECKLKVEYGWPWAGDQKLGIQPENQMMKFENKQTRTGVAEYHIG